MARPEFDFRVLLLTGTNFLHVNNRSIRERYCQLLARELRGQLNFSKQEPSLQHKNKQKRLCEIQLLLEFWLYFWFPKRLVTFLSFTFFNIQMRFTSGVDSKEIELLKFYSRALVQLTLNQRIFHRHKRKHKFLQGFKRCLTARITLRPYSTPSQPSNLFPDLLVRVRKV